MKTSLKGDLAYDLIRRDIVHCGIMPGAVMSEGALMERYSIGKATCRVALQRLSMDGLILSLPRQGYRISPITTKDVDEIFDLRMAVETHATRSAAGRVDRAELERLEAACRAGTEKKVGAQIDHFLDANREFHMTIARAGGNRRLCDVLSDLFDGMTRLVALGFGVQKVRPGIDRDHVDLIESLSRGDAAAAEVVMVRHIETFREMTIRKIMDTIRDMPGLELQDAVTGRTGGGRPNGAHGDLGGDRASGSGTRDCP